MKDFQLTRVPNWSKASRHPDFASPITPEPPPAPISLPAPQATAATASEKKPAAASDEKKIAWPVVAKKNPAVAVVEKKSATPATPIDPAIEPAASGLPPCPSCGCLVAWRPRVRQRWNFDWRCTCCEPPSDVGAVDRVVVIEVDLFGGLSVARRVSVPVDLVGGLFFVDDLPEPWAGFWRAVVVDGRDGAAVEACERVTMAVVAGGS